MQLPSENAIAATMMSICCMGRPIPRSSAATRPYWNAAFTSNGQTFHALRAVCTLADRAHANYLARLHR